MCKCYETMITNVLKSYAQAHSVNFKRLYEKFVLGYFKREYPQYSARVAYIETCRSA